MTDVARDSPAAHPAQNLWGMLRSGRLQPLCSQHISSWVLWPLLPKQVLLVGGRVQSTAPVQGVTDPAAGNAPQQGGWNRHHACMRVLGLRGQALVVGGLLREAARSFLHV